MANENVCCVVDCIESPDVKPSAFEEEFGIKLGLCKIHAKAFHENFQKKSGLLGSFSKAGGSLNIVGILANALSHFSTEDKSKKLTSILSMKYGKDVGGAISALVSSAGDGAVDIAPGSTSVAVDQAMATKWWKDFFKATGINELANKQWLISYVGNNTKSIKEAINEAASSTDDDEEEEDEEETERKPRRSWADWARPKVQGVKNFLDTGPSGKFGKKKNELAAKLAVAGAVTLYDQLINTILAKVGLSQNDIPAMYDIYKKSIMPIFASKGSCSAADLNKIAGGDPQKYKKLKTAYDSIQSLSTELRVAKI